MITFNRLGTYGLLGNQMFQYATLYAIAKTNNYEYGVPYSNVGEVHFKNFFLPNCFLNLTAKDSSFYPVKYKAIEKQFNYNAGIFGILDDTDICGYFQSEKYFVKYRQDILQEFKFKSDIENQAKDIRSITKNRVISLHIRMGDYVNQQQNHPVCSIDYYKEALTHLPEDCLLFIFSDETEKASDMFKSLNRPFVIPDTNNKYVDMCLMSLCDYHIIANSSFSWWGAWLSNSKKVIAPSKWFGSADHMPKNWSDIYCKNWFII
jgi:hypothetical protein